MRNSKSRIEIFSGFCPTQDKWERIEQTYHEITTLGSPHPQFIEGNMMCPYVCLRQIECSLYDKCPVKSGDWATDNMDVFIAMQFKDQSGVLRSIHTDVIKPVCKDFGLNAFVVTDVEYNEGIYDEIIKSITKSRFIIADLSYANNGAYYEAGYAKGQGKKVIHSCCKNWFDMNGVHFDASGLNLILYDNDEDFTDKLRKRIRSTFFTG